MTTYDNVGRICSHVQVGKLSTGDSLDMSPKDEASITANDATLKDMEVSCLLDLPHCITIHRVFLSAKWDFGTVMHDGLILKKYTGWILLLVSTGCRNFFSFR